MQILYKIRTRFTKLSYNIEEYIQERKAWSQKKPVK